MPNRDSQFDRFEYKPPLLAHKYGTKTKILSDPFLLSHLARLCAPSTYQPTINELITTIYQSMLVTVVNTLFPRKIAKVETRMGASHPQEGFYEGPVIAPDTKVVVVNLARAGTVPSHICYTALNYFLNPSNIRQDHVGIGRQVGKDDQVVGSSVSGHKIGGDIENAFVLFPDPMGATGSTILKALELYKGISGTPKAFIGLHCIVTPEYIRNVTENYPDFEIFSVRLDRGLSSDEVLKTEPGTRIKEERGLNDKQYIVPGGGGFGEILNNSYV